jgi:hypothetical protein
MALKPCSSCGQRYSGKAVAVYAAWMEGEKRIAYKASLCMICLRTFVAEYVKRSIARGFEESCDECGATGKGRYHPIWVNTYLPKREAEAFELLFCEDDNIVARGQLVSISNQLPDRQPVSSQGPANERENADSVPW